MPHFEDRRAGRIGAAGLGAPVAPSEKELRRREFGARLALWMAGRSSRNRTLLDRLCRRLIEKASHRDPQHDFMRDPEIDDDQGFDADELDRYQRGDGG